MNTSHLTHLHSKSAGQNSQKAPHHSTYPQIQLLLYSHLDQGSKSDLATPGRTDSDNTHGFVGK